MTDYEQAAALIEENEDEAEFIGPRSAEVIEAAESALGFRFPPTYRRFLAEYGAGNIGATEIYGVIDANFVDSSIPDAVWYNLDLRRREGYDGLFAFYGVGDGREFCLDTSRVSSDGEMRVVCATRRRRTRGDRIRLRQRVPDACPRSTWSALGRRVTP